MCRGDLRADAGFALGHNRIGKADDVDAFLEHGVGEVAGEGGVAEHDGSDGMRALQNFETAVGHLFAEKFRIGLEAVA